MDQLIVEICDLCARVEPDLKADSLMRRIQFMGYELNAKTSGDFSQTQKLAALNHFFFELKDFATPLDPQIHDPLSLHLLNRVFSTRVGSSRVLAILYRHLGEQIGLKLEFVDLQPNCYLKYLDNGISRYIDLSRKGRTMSSEELLESLQASAKLKPQAGTLCEVVGADAYIVEYLQVLKRAYGHRGHLEPLLEIQNWILEYQPSNTSVMAERAILLNQLGYFRNAFTDLKRYFTFSERDLAPAELVALHDELSKRFSPRGPEPILH